MSAAIDVTRRPGLAYQHAFDWLAVRLYGTGGYPWQETTAAMTLTDGGRTLYEWRKGESRARTVALEVMVR